MGKYKRISVVLILALIALLVVNNVFYYWVSKHTLEKKMMDTMATEALQVHASLLRTIQGEQFVERLVGERLRSDSVAAQAELGPDIRRISNTQLEALADKLQINGIVLMPSDRGELAVDKSSTPGQIGMKMKDQGIVEKALHELLQLRDIVSFNWGQRLEHFWSPPYEGWDPGGAMEKHGYFYDGSTNYITGPYINDAVFLDYQKQLGINAIISGIRTTNPTILEISGINPSTFGNSRDATLSQYMPSYWPRQILPVFFGSYDYANRTMDEGIVDEVLRTRKPVSYDALLNGKHVFKTFLPVKADELNDIGFGIDTYVIAITTDYGQIQSELDETMLQLLLIIIVATCFCIAVMFVLNYSFAKSQDKAVSDTQATYVDELNTLFRSIRGQRHDFINHVSTIHALVELGQINELKNYTEEMIGDVRSIGDLIQIGEPAVAALVQSKVMRAENENIRFVHHFEELPAFPPGAKSVDLVRLIGSLVDTAFGEAARVRPEQRYVELRCWLEQQLLHVAVTSPDGGKDAPGTASSSSVTQRSVGADIAVASEIAAKYKGRIQADANGAGIRLHAAIPLEPAG
ncbi:Spo0B domain-containing protein [Paenibacillus athensensis]|uniref:SpoOB alpha-helical domain-containing protein n=1 Tax=Paenibacillus athensensis TaxID=1967502 RepID=A0A4Y8Q901_9BACL|nr:Spo0B domain-containing protein [Paenibacillus athensensis]MCD1260076.1 Spo0B domain-containing protein [Paenibacillus athensensis]